MKLSIVKLGQARGVVEQEYVGTAWVGTLVAMEIIQLQQQTSAFLTFLQTYVVCYHSRKCTRYTLGKAYTGTLKSAERSSLAFEFHTSY